VNELSLFSSSWLLRYYFGSDHPFKIRLINFFHRQLGEPRFLTRTLSGAVLALDLVDLVSREVLRSGSYHPEVLAEFERVADNEEVLWDVGAHVGSIGLSCATRSWCREVHCFEPYPPTMKKLRRNRELNPKLNVQLHEIALAGDTAERPFFGGLSGNIGIAGFGDYWGTESIRIRPEKGDDLIAAGRATAPTLLKIDAEGSELAVLEGLAKTFASTPPKAVVFETHLAPDGKPSDQPVHLWLQERGYRIKVLTSSHPGPTQNAIAELPLTESRNSRA
jgi:FkbM family methyltransferase